MQIVGRSVDRIDESQPGLQGRTTYARDFRDWKAGCRIRDEPLASPKRVQRIAVFRPDAIRVGVSRAKLTIESSEVKTADRVGPSWALWQGSYGEADVVKSYPNNFGDATETRAEDEAANSNRGRNVRRADNDVVDVARAQLCARRPLS